MPREHDLRTPFRQHQGPGRRATLPRQRNQEPKIANFPVFPAWLLFPEVSFGHPSHHGCTMFAIYYRLFSTMSIHVAAGWPKKSKEKPTRRAAPASPRGASRALSPCLRRDRRSKKRLRAVVRHLPDNRPLRAIESVLAQRFGMKPGRTRFWMSVSSTPKVASCR